MRTEQFDFFLPSTLIAQYPLQERSASRLLCLESNGGSSAATISHRQFSELPSLLHPHDLLIFNNTKVIKARLFGQKLSGGKVEVLVERVLPDRGSVQHLALAQIGTNKRVKIGTKLFLENAIAAEIIGKQDDFFIVQFSTTETIWQLLENYGHIPLPPYIERAADATLDLVRYQSIFAEREGAVAAPTASLHFDENIMAQLKAKNIDMAFVTLHVGAGTFQPVRVQEITQHKMHAEYMELSAEVCEKIKETKARGGRVIAVGTTCVRCLETAAQFGEGVVKPFVGDTDIFIYPGYNFRCVDALITNFHLPKSTLLMLVCAFAGYDNVMRAYQEAVKMQYRFFSYGDAMFIEGRRGSLSRVDFQGQVHGDLM